MVRPHTEPLRWGVLSTGRIAETFVRVAARVGPTAGVVAAIASRTRASADAFVPDVLAPDCRRHADYSSLVNDPEVDAVYIATPHPMHLEWGVRAADAGKHVLCEKPLTMNRREADIMIDAARRNGILLMEAFMYRATPRTVRIVDLVREGRLGEVRMVDVSFGHVGADAGIPRLVEKALGGGAILDVGCYTASIVRLVVGAATGTAFAEPDHVAGVARLNPDFGTDDWAAATLSFPGGIVATMTVSARLPLENRMLIHGTRGVLRLTAPWHPGPGATIELDRRDGSPEIIAAAADPDPFGLQLRAFAQAARAGETEYPAMTWADSQGNMTTLDRWRQAVGLRYDADRA